MDKWSEEWLYLVSLPLDYRKDLLILVGCNAILSYFFEKYFIYWFSNCYNKAKAAKK